jgi:aminoglycoside/choline kinase family phosphotransferase
VSTNPERDAFLKRALALLAGDPPESFALTRLAGDGSARDIYRVRYAGATAVLVVNPLVAEPGQPDENETFVRVRDYLQQRGVRVPALYAADLHRGFLLVEDLGDQRLYDVVRSAAPNAVREEIAPLYAHAIAMLVALQAPGVPPFPADVGNPPYDAEFVVQQEARYFHTEFVAGWMGHEIPFADIESECRELAADATRPVPGATGRCLHRDYQSRNLMVLPGKRGLAVIDFQGARQGPPEYDLAALLLDPYSALPGALRQELLLRYLREAADAGVAGIPVLADRAGAAHGEEMEDPWGWAILDRYGESAFRWRRRFLANAANRLMQALGAFAKLGGRLGRPGFLEHVGTGLGNLDAVLASLGRAPRLRDVTRELVALHASREEPSR